MTNPEAATALEKARPMQQDDVRLFTALWPDERLRARLGRERDRWRWPPAARPVDDARLHMTLHFIGAFARSRTAALESALEALPIAPAILRALGPELWPGGIAVLRFSAAPALAELHASIGAALQAFGVALDARPFAPHVTLARRARGATPPARPVDLEWHTSAFALVESVPGAQASYRVLRSFGAG